jgi:hypothetical protein
MFSQINNKKTIKNSVIIFSITVLFLLVLGYNFSVWDINYNGVMWNWRGSFMGFDMDPALAQPMGRTYFLISHGFSGLGNLYHLAVVFHIVFLVLLYKPFKRSIKQWKENSDKTFISDKSFDKGSWSLLIIVMFILNILLILHEGNFSFLTDVTEFAAPHQNNALLHYHSLLYWKGRGILFVALTAIYPVIIYLDKVMSAKEITPITIIPSHYQAVINLKNE